MPRQWYNPISYIKGMINKESTQQTLECGNPACRRGTIDDDVMLFEIKRGKVYHLGNCPEKALGYYSRQQGFSELGEFVRVDRAKAYNLLYGDVNNQPATHPVIRALPRESLLEQKVG